MVYDHEMPPVHFTCMIRFFILNKMSEECILQYHNAETIIILHCINNEIIIPGRFSYEVY